MWNVNFTLLNYWPRCRFDFLFILALQTKNADYFSSYVTEDFTTYINRKRKNNCHGNHIEMQAMAEMYNRPVEVYQYGIG